MAQTVFEWTVIIFYFALLALPVVGIVVGLKYFPPDGDTGSGPSSDQEAPNQ